jgi:hypothetical protein
MLAGMRARVSREALTDRAVEYLRNNHGRLWY